MKCKVWVQVTFLHGYVIVSTPFVEKKLFFLDLYQKPVDHINYSV